MDLVWKTRDGKRIKVKDMTNAHVYNTYRFVQRRIPEVQAEANAAAGYSGQGDMANSYAGHAADAAEDTVARLQMWEQVFEHELKLRGT